jgi:deoxyribose-phosphate aldolase
MKESLRDIAKMIDHSLLHPTMTDQELIAGCQLAKKYDVASVCIKPYAVQLAKEQLKGSDVNVGTVIGFPSGSHKTEAKLYEAELALAEGVVELDMVLNIGKALSRDWEYIRREIKAINDLTVSKGALLKVIFETDYVAQDELLIQLCHICSEIAIAFVKTSTGYNYVKQADGQNTYAGATDHVLKLMRRECPPSVQVKAAGKVKTLDDVLRVRSLGVTRIGATSTANILEEAKTRILGLSTDKSKQPASVAGTSDY